MQHVKLHEPLTTINIAQQQRLNPSEFMHILRFEDESAFEMFRIACASGTAFLIAQLLDIQIFDRLRQRQWWKAPVASSFLGSLVDTITFFFLAFAGTGLPWASWALGDFGAKLVVIAVLLYPFKLLVTPIARGTRSA